jgi:hypothetical protein
LQMQHVVGFSLRGVGTGRAISKAAQKSVAPFCAREDHRGKYVCT